MAIDIDKKKAKKLDKVNVPEMFYQTFLSNIPAGKSTIVDRLRNINPTARGRGLSRVVKKLTQTEWDDLYAYAAKARAAIVGCDRETELKPAICGKALAIRMEKLGVTNPVAWSPSKVYKPRKTSTEVSDAELDQLDDDATADVVTQVATPVTISTAENVDEVTGDELDMLGEEVKQQQA